MSKQEPIVKVTSHLHEMATAANGMDRIKLFKLGSTFKGMATKAAELTGESVILSYEEMGSKNGKPHFYVSIATEDNGHAFTLGQTVTYDQLTDSFSMFGDIFEIDRSLQDKGISAHFGKFIRKLATDHGFTSMEINANLDVGGYAWLRKGAVPNNNFYYLMDELIEGLEDPAAIKKARKLQKMAEKMSAEELKFFLLSDDLRDYKDVFLNSGWNGTFDLQDRMTLAALSEERAELHTLMNRELKKFGDAPFLSEKEKARLLNPFTPRKKDIPKKALTANEQILNGYIKQQTHLLRYADGLSDELIATLSKTDQPLNDALVSWLSEMEDTRDMATTAGRSWQKGFEETVASLREPAWDELEETLTEQLQELAITEAQGAAHIIQGAIPTVLGLQTPPADKLFAIVKSQPLEGKVLSEWLAKAKRTDVDSIVTQAKAGIIQGQTPIQVTRTIMGNRENDFEDGIAKRKARRDIQTLTRTITNGIQNEAKQALYDANEDIFDQEQFVSTLDSRTTLVCAMNDNKVFKRRTGPMPPLHFNCRSLRVPFINADRLGNRAFDPSTEKSLVKEYAEQNNLEGVTSRDKLPRGTKGDFDAWARKRRRELIGQVPSTTSYADWLKGQTPEFQDELLGKGKAELFREGNLTLDNFVSRDGKALSLTELKAKQGITPAPTKVLSSREASAITTLSSAEKSRPYKDQNFSWEVEKHRELLAEGKKVFAEIDPDLKNYTKRYMTDFRFWQPLNEAMRNNEVLPDRLLKGKQALDVVTRMHTIPVDRLYRGDKSLPLNINEASNLVGSTQQQSSFLSTSIGPRAATDFGIRRELEKGWKPPKPEAGIASTLLEFNTKDRPPHGVYISAANDTKKVADMNKRIEKTGQMEGESEVLLPSGKSYKIVGIREEIVYNKTYEQEVKTLVYEAVFID